MTPPVVLVPGGIGGTGGLSIDLRNLAVGLAQRGRSVVVAGADESDRAFAALEGVTLAPLRPVRAGRATATFALQLGMRGVLRTHRGAIVHAFGCMPSYLTLSALAAARLERCPTVWTPMFHPLRARVWRRRLALRPMLAFDAVAPLAARFTDAVGAATEAEADVFRRAGARRVELLPPVVEGASAVPEEQAASFRKAIGVGRAPLVVVVASREEPRKGLDFGWASFARLQQDLPQARLAVVGLAASQRPLPEGAVLVGRVDDATLASALRAADVVFVPSLFEAFSRVVIEAWQQESSVVVSDGVALGPTVAAGGGGAVVPYGDVEAAASALGALLRDRRRSAASGRRGRQLVEERFELDTLLNHVERVYDDVSRHGRRGAAAHLELAR
jgi:glycosyltransferase involved in cell wall biosynthesis